MKLFLDDTYFQGEINLPFLAAKSGPPVGQAARTITVGENTLEWFIAKYEPLYMTELLGATLYKNFVEGLAADPVNSIWTALKGEIFWAGGKNDEYKYSPAANYVYFFAMRDGRTQTTIKGEVRGKSDYSDNVTDQAKLIKAWNNMAIQSHRIRAYLANNWNAYKGYTDGRYNRCCDIFEPINWL